MNELGAQLHDFCSDWIQREPALALCYRFAVRQAHWLAAVVLIEEQLQAMFALSNQDLAQAKLAWWADEADLALSGAPRHPLTHALIAEGSDLHALPELTRAACEWITLSTASDSVQQRDQLAAFAAGASKLIDEGDSAAIWTELALKRQLQCYAKPERYGPGVFNRDVLAEFQLKSSQIGDPAVVGRALSAQLSSIQMTLKNLLHVRRPRQQSATRAYALLHARESGVWAKLTVPTRQAEFLPTLPGMTGLVKAWWIARG